MNKKNQKAFLSDILEHYLIYQNKSASSKPVPEAKYSLIISNENTNKKSDNFREMIIKKN